MERQLSDMDAIQQEKTKDIERKGAHPLDPEGKTMAEHKRYTFDIIDTPVDPLR